MGQVKTEGKGFLLCARLPHQNKETVDSEIKFVFLPDASPFFFHTTKPTFLTASFNWYQERAPMALFEAAKPGNPTEASMAVAERELSQEKKGRPGCGH